MFDESPNSEVLQLGLEKINYVDFLGNENFLSIFPNQNLDVGFGMLDETLILCSQEIIDPFWEIFMESLLKKINKGHVKINLFQVGTKNFISTFQSHVMVNCKLFLFQYQSKPHRLMGGIVAHLLLLRMGLIGDLKDRDKDDSNSRVNSLQPGD